MIVLEILVIVVVVALQARVYWQNKQKAAELAFFFPEKEQLYLQAAGQAPVRPQTAGDHPLKALVQGQPYILAEEPGRIFRVKGRDGEFYLISEKPGEASAAPATSFLLTQKELEAIPAKPGFQLLAQPAPAQAKAGPQLPAAHNPSAGFAGLLQEIGDFLRRNQGTINSLDHVKDMSGRRLETLAARLQATTSTPLYMGLLGTFLGVILGLFTVVTEGINDESIGRFLLAVVVAIIGSFFGLVFTLLSNAAYRQAHERATDRYNGWLSFLQLQLLPRLQSELAHGLSHIKHLLDDFNQDFLRRIADFKAVFSDLNQYVGLQERFITALQQSDFSQLTEANLRFFEQIQKNESLFERFGQYLQGLNESMDLGRQAAVDIREIVGQLRQLDDVQGYLRQNEESIRTQLGYLAAHQDKMEQLTRGIQQHFIEAGDEIGALVQRRLQIMQKEEQDAGEALRQHFERLKQENVYQKIAEQLQPIRQMENDVQGMRELFADTLKHLLETQQYLIRKINQDGQTQGRVLKEMELLNQHMQQLTERRSWVQRILGGR